MIMASASACSSISTPNSSFLPPTCPLQFHFTRINSHSHFKNFAVSCTSSGVNFHKHSLLRPSKLKAVAEEQGILVAEQEPSTQPAGAASDPTVSVAVSPADALTMFFQGMEGITHLKVRYLEGIASVEGSSVEDVDNIETEHYNHHHHHHAKAPAHAPANAPVHAPAKAPVHAPKKVPVHAPAKSPIHTPKKAPVHAPVHAPAKSPVHSPPKAPVHPPVSPPHGCVAMCTSYCKPVSPKRPCMKTCTACCAKCKCVPGFMKCSNWDNVMIHGYTVKCP
ncbi:nischarin-like isoform X2 [Sesamum indicum]|nr:nischarin-like isoform X2 [Sesamum indicum]